MTIAVPTAKEIILVITEKFGFELKTSGTTKSGSHVKGNKTQSGKYIGTNSMGNDTIITIPTNYDKKSQKSMGIFRNILRDLKISKKEFQNHLKELKKIK